MVLSRKEVELFVTAVGYTDAHLFVHITNPASVLLCVYYLVWKAICCFSQALVSQAHFQASLFLEEAMNIDFFSFFLPLLLKQPSL